MTDDDLLSISGIQHFVFCRRQWALIHIEQQWSENVLTVSGELMHQNAHDGTSTEKRGDVLISRGMPVKSRELGLTGVCDVVEFHKSSDGALLHGGRGLKYYFGVDCLYHFLGRPPHGGRGLKLTKETGTCAACKRRPPHGGRGLKSKF